MELEQWLATLQVGDEVEVKTLRNSPGRIGHVDKILPKTIQINGDYFKKTDGNQYGGTNRQKRWIVPVTQAARDFKERQELQAFCRTYHWECSLAQLRTIRALTFEAWQHDERLEEIQTILERRRTDE